MKTERVSLSAFVDPDDYERLAERARPEDRSMSAEIRLALREHLHRRPSGELRQALGAQACRGRRGRPMTLLGKLGLSPESAALEGDAR